MSEQHLLFIKLFIAILCVGVSQNADAQTNTNDSIAKEEVLAEVEVTGSRRFSLSSTVSRQILTRKELQELNSFSVADAIRYFSGVQLKDYGGIGGLKTVNIRSMGTQHVGVFIDGLQISNAPNGTVDLGKFSLDNIESIELYNGNNPDILQPAKAYFASSTLMLKTAKPQFDSTKNFHLKGSFRTGSFGLINPSVLYEKDLKNNWGFSLNTEYVTAHGRYKYSYYVARGYDTTAIRQNADVNALRIESSVLKTLKNKGEFITKIYYYHSERGLPGAIVANKFYNPQRLWDKNFFLQSSFKKKFFKNYELLAQVKYSNDFTKYQDPDYITVSGILENKYHQQEMYTSLAQKLKINKWWNLGLSTDFVFNKLDANLHRFSYPTRLSYTGVLTNHFSFHRFSINTSLLGTYFDEKVKYNFASPDKKAFSPFIGINWQPFNKENFRIRSFYKESLRMPTFNDLYYTLIGNIYLEPEYTKQFDLGFTWVKERSSMLDMLSIQSDIYYNKVENKIIAIPSTNLFRWMMINQGLIEIKGGEINISTTKSFPNNWNAAISLNYTYQKALNKTNGDISYNHIIPYIPVHSGTVHGSFKKDAWSLTYSFIYTGERYILPENILRNYFPPWYTTDIGLFFEQTIKKKLLKTGLEINNIFNQYYDVVINFPMPGRSYRVYFQIKI